MSLDLWQVIVIDLLVYFNLLMGIVFYGLNSWQLNLYLLAMVWISYYLL